METGTDGAVDEARIELSRIEEAISQSTADGNTYVAAALHFRAAQICLASPNAQDPATREEALTHLWASWQLQPEDLDIRTVLAHHLEREEQLEDAAGLYSSTAEHIRNEKERAQLLFRASELLGLAGEVTEALDALKRIDPVQDPDLVRHRAHRLSAVLDSLGPDQVEARLQALQLLLDSLEGDARFERAVELARLLDQVGREQEARQAWRDALAVRPADPVALAPVQAQLEQEERFEELAEVLELAARSASHEQQPALLRQAATLIENRLSDPSRAARFWWKAWEMDPTSALEPGRLKQLYTSIEQWHSYRRVLEHEILRAVSTEAKVMAYRELARLQQEVFEDLQAAARTYGYILHLIPDDVQALTARVDIFEQLRLDNDLTLALRRFAAHTRDSGRRDELGRRLARLEVRLPDSSYLMRTLRGLDPSDERNRELVRELRDLPQAKGEPLGRELGMMQLKMELQAGTPSCVGLALELARESIDADEPGRAVECYRRVLELSPDHAVARQGLTALARRGEPRQPTAAELAEQAQQLGQDQPERAVRQLVRAATLAQQNDPSGLETIQEYLRLAVEACPMGATVELQLVEEALRSAGMHSELAQLLEDQAAAERQPGRRKDTLRALAQLCREKLQDPHRSLDVLTRVLEIDPLDTEVIHQVRELHAQLGNHEALAQVLEDLLLQAASRDRIPLLAELGRLYADRLHDRSSALGRYGELLAMVPNDSVALSFCRAHDEASGNYRSVAVMLCRAAEAADEPLARAEIHREIAQIAEQRLSDADFAISSSARRPRVGDLIREKIPAEDVIPLVKRTLEYYRDNAKKRERMARFIDRIGIEDVKDALG